MDQPNMNSPMAAIQLPATRTTIRAHAARIVVTWPASSDTTTKIETATPAGLSPIECWLANSAPFSPP